jgi:post-segregation antitoxin (ccd killing protein)
MYSPKISDEYIPEIYRLAKDRGMHMTRLVNEMIARALKDIKENRKPNMEVSNEKDS